MNGITQKIITTEKALDEDEQILISTERLKQLELLEKNLPNMIEKAISDHKKEKLKMLHEKDKLNPAAVNLRVKKYNAKHRDEINARRRQKKMENNTQKTNYIVDSLNTTQSKQPEIATPKTIVANLATNKDFIVRFDL